MSLEERPQADLFFADLLRIRCEARQRSAHDRRHRVGALGGRAVKSSQSANCGAGPAYWRVAGVPVSARPGRGADALPVQHLLNPPAADLLKKVAVM